MSLDISQGQTVQADSALEPTERFIRLLSNTGATERFLPSRGERLSPRLSERARVVGRSDEALVLQAPGDLRGRDEVTAVVVVLLLAQRLSIRGGG